MSELALHLSRKTEMHPTVKREKRKVTTWCGLAPEGHQLIDNVENTTCPLCLIAWRKFVSDNSYLFNVDEINGI